MRITWAQPEDLLAHELVQSEAEGRDVTAIRQRWIAAGGNAEASVSGASAEPASEDLRELARELLDELAAPAICETWDDIRARLSIDAASLLDAEQYQRRVRGAWNGRAAGCLLGKPVEKIPREGIEEILRATGKWPLSGWFTAEGLPDQVAQKWPWNRRSAPTSLAENIAGMPEDDDLNYPIMALALVEDSGPDFTTDDVATLWLNWLPAGRAFTAERAAYRNLLEARSAPESATHWNPFREWIGALIRTDLYGWINPHDLESALRMAWTDARLSHTGNGIYGAMWASALTWASLRATSVEEVLDLAMQGVVPGSALEEAIVFGRKLGKNCDLSEQGIAAAIDSLHKKYGHLHWVHVLNNAAVIAFAIQAGQGDFGQSIALAVLPGWDTDSAGATVGSVVAALAQGDIPQYWTAPLLGQIATSLPSPGVSGGTLRIDDLAERTIALGQLNNRANSGETPHPLVGPRVAVVGSANVDLVTQVGRMPLPGETVLGGNLVRSAGGKGANQACAAARAGATATDFVGCIGNDGLEHILVSSLAEAGVNPRGMRHLEMATGTALITVDAAGENSIVVSPGANSQVEIGPAEKAFLAEANVILGQLEIPQLALIQAGLSRKPGAVMVLNAAPSAPLEDSLWEQVDILIVNEHEAEELAGFQDTPEKLADALLNRVNTVIITLGSAGSLLARRNENSVKMAAFPANAVDTVGAGDTFCGVFAAALAQGENLGRACHLGAAAAAIAVTRPGAQAAIPTSAEVKALMREKQEIGG